MVLGAFLPHLQESHMVRTGAARVALCSPPFRRHWIFNSFRNERSWRLGVASALEMVVPAGYAPASSGYQPDALLLSYRTEIGSSGAPWQRRSRFLLWLIICDLWFDSESHRAENKPHLHRANSNDTAWLVTAPWEQLTLVTDHRFHWPLLSCAKRCQPIT